MSVCVCVCGGGGGGGGGGDEWEEVGWGNSNMSFNAAVYIDNHVNSRDTSVCMCGGGRRVDGRSNMPYRNVIVGVLVDQRSVE